MISFPECDAVCGFGGDHACDDFPGCRGDNIGDKGGFHLAVGIKNVQQNGFKAPAACRGKISPHGFAHSLKLMASGTLGFENLFAPGFVALGFKRFLVLVEHLQAGAGRNIHELGDLFREGGVFLSHGKFQPAQVDLTLGNLFRGNRIKQQIG